MAEIKVFKMNDYDWIAATDTEAAIKFYVEEWDGTVEWVGEGQPEELSDEAMDALLFHYDPDDIEEGEPEVVTFRTRLNELIELGCTFPDFFATTEI